MHCEAYVTENKLLVCGTEEIRQVVPASFKFLSRTLNALKYIAKYRYIFRLSRPCFAYGFIVE
jgi:hypothetical protein